MPGDTIYEAAYDETVKKRVKDIELSSIHKPTFTGSMEQLKLLRDMFSYAIIREMEMMQYLGARCDRIG